MSTIQERAMLVGLHISSWGAQRTDRQATVDVISQKQAASDAGSFQKCLIPPSELQKVKTAEGKMRREFYRLSLAWGNDGSRIISADAFFPFQAAMDVCRREFETAVEDFISRYPLLMALAPQRLGTMYDAREFPAAHELENRFGVQLTIMPVPSGEDFRVDIGAEAEQTIRNQIEQTVAQRQNAAQQELWERVRDSLKAFSTTLTSPGKKFRDSTLRNLQELARMTPTLSLVEDPELKALCEEVEDLLALSPENLRTSGETRQETAASIKDKVTAIEDRLAGAFV